MHRHIYGRLFVIFILGVLATFAFYPLQRTLILDRVVHEDFSGSTPAGKPKVDKVSYRHPLSFTFFRTETEGEYWCPKCGKWEPSAVGPLGKCPDCGGRFTTDAALPGVQTAKIHQKVYVRGTITPGLDLRGGSQILYKADASQVKGQSVTDATSRAVDIIRMRVDAYGMKEPRINVKGQDEILVQIPGASQSEVDRVKEVIKKSGHLEFRIVEDDAAKLREALELGPKGMKLPGYTVMDMQSARSHLPTNYTVRQGDTLNAIGKGYYQSDEGKYFIYYANRDKLPSLDAPLTAGTELTIPREKLLISDKVELDGKHIVRANEDSSVGWRVSLDFDPAGKHRFARVTGDNINRRMAIVMDGSLYSAPVIRTRIYGSAEITGDFTQKEARDLATVLQAGSLPVSLSLASEETIGPSLGESAVNNGVQALLVASILVVVFGVIYYHVAGIVADFALIYNIILILGVMALFNATITLPGIGGLVLTMGMAIDANILIYERIREEKERGATLLTALRNGYDRAYITIFDSNVTTLITAVILYWLGTGPVKGFAITLSAGLLVSMFSSLYGTKAILEFLVTKGIIKDLTMLHIFRHPNVGFLALRRFFIAFSVAGILFGIVVFGYQYSRGALLDTDFAGGIHVIAGFDKPRLRTEVTKSVLAAVPDCEIQSVGQGISHGANEEFKSFSIRMPLLPSEVGKSSSLDSDPRLAKIRTALGLDKFDKTESIGSIVAKRLKINAFLSVLAAWASIVVYVWLRFEFRFGVTAVVALVHDVLVTLGCLGICGALGWIDGKFSLSIVAAILTIIGYSINDTIVVFDRVRENLRKRRREDFISIINDSINQTLSRTILTSATVLVSSLVLLFVGAREGGVLQGFAFCMTIGVITGTYSSIYIASALVVSWHLHDEKKRVRATGQVPAGR